MTCKILCILSILASGSAHAQCSALLGGWSTHFASSNEYGQDWIQDHKAYGIECDGYSAVTMTNSYGDRSYGAGYEYKMKYGFGAYAGAWTGYEADVIAVPALTFSHNISRIGASFMILPESAVVFFRVRL